MRRLAALLLLTSPAQATFDQVGEVVLGTAQTLEQGELLVGLFSPIGYGVNDALTMFIHPVNWALLTPNAAFRWRLFEGSGVRVSAAFGGAGTVPTEDTVGGDHRRPLGHVDAGLLTSVEVGGGVVLTARVGYQRDVNPDDDDFDGAVTIGWVISPSSFLQLQGGVQVGREAGLKAPSAHLTYVHSFGALHVAGGVAYGEFPLGLESGAVAACPNDWAAPCVWPVVDVFWRF